MTHDQLLRQLTRRCFASNQKTVADELGISESLLSDTLNGYRMPCPKLLRALGLERRVTYHPTDSA